MSKENKKEEKNFIKEAIDFIKDLVIIILVVLFIRTFLIMPFQISGQSMYDSYYDKEFIIVDRFSYLNIPNITTTPKRWDVIVFKPWVDHNREYFIKRIIWLPWETIKIESWEVFLLNDTTWKFIKLNEWYLDKENNGKTYIRGDWTTHIYKVPEGSYFVMWDNRQHSTDSRTCFSDCNKRWNYISKSDITWKVFIDLWYFNIKEFKFIHPEYGIDTHPKFFNSPWSYNYMLY